MSDASPRNFRASWVVILALALFSGLSAEGAASQASASLVLAWNPSSSPSIAGYMVYYGTDGINFDSSVDTTNDFTTVAGLTPGGTYYFEVVAYDDYNDDSPPSGKIEFTVPNPTPTLTVVGSPANAGSVTGGGVYAAGASVMVTATANSGYTFANWTENGIVKSVTPDYRLTVVSNFSLSANFTVAGNGGSTGTGETNGNTNFTLVVSGNGSLTPYRRGEALAEGKKFTMTALAGRGSVFADWVSNGVVVATTAKYTFLAESNVTLEASFIPNPFIPVTGTYRGLFCDTQNVAEESSGSFVATVASGGGFTARLHLGAASYSYAGRFSLAGVAFESIPRQGLSPITVHLQLDLSNGPMTGTISDGTWTSDLRANAAIYSKANPAPQAGRYTLLIPGSDNSTVQPGGNGFGAVTVDALGNVSLSGALGDGTPVTCAGVVAGQGQWPFYVSLYGGKGSILGWLSFTNDGVGGQVDWFKLPEAKAKLYPGGFASGTEAIGSIYRHTNGVPVLGFTNGLISLVNGNLAESITNQVSLGADVAAGDEGAAKLTFRPLSGLFHGSVMNPETGKLISVDGVVLQNQNFGAGFFVGTNESGSVLLSQAE